MKTFFKSSAFTFILFCLLGAVFAQQTYQIKLDILDEKGVPKTYKITGWFNEKPNSDRYIFLDKATGDYINFKSRVTPYNREVIETTRRFNIILTDFAKVCGVCKQSKDTFVIIDLASIPDCPEENLIVELSLERNTNKLIIEFYPYVSKYPFKNEEEVNRVLLDIDKLDLWCDSNQ